MGILKLSTWGISKIITDIENYKDWIRVINRESKDVNSKFNKWNIKHNQFYTIYFTQDIEEEESQLPDRIMQLRMIESLAPLHRYLDEELGFAECLTPEFNRFYDKDGNATLTYLITYRFSFNKLSIWWVIRSLIKLGIITAGIVSFYKYDMMTWIQNLI